MKIDIINEDENIKYKIRYIFVLTLLSYRAKCGRFNCLDRIQLRYIHVDLSAAAVSTELQGKIQTNKYCL